MTPEVERALVEALKWYAESWRYDYDETCCFDGSPKPSRGGKKRQPDSQDGVLADNGDRANAALALISESTP